MEKTKSISLILGVLIMSIFIVYLVFAWTEPPYGGTCTNPPCPPGGNVPAPLNVSLNAQSKEGALVIGTNSGLTTGLIVQYGKVGIGTTGPADKLEVAGGYIVPAGGYGLNWRDNIWGGSGDDAWIRYYQESGENTKLQIGINNDADDDLEFYQAGAARMTIYNGNVGIGTTGPGAKLDIQVSAGSDAVKINTFKFRPISATEMGVYDSGGNQVLIFDEGI